MDFMRDSLFSRFRAAFLGALLGETIGETGLVQQSESLWVAIEQGVSHRKPDDSTTLGWSRLLMAQTAQLLAEPHLPAVDLSLPLPDPLPNSTTGWVMATLPLALFYHDQPAAFQTVLQTTQQHSQTLLLNGATRAFPSDTAVAVAVIGQTISLMLRERLIPQDVIPQVMQDLELELDGTLAQQLTQVQAWLECSTSLAAVADWLRRYTTAAAPSACDSLPIALALYGFLSIPDHFRLSLARLVQVCQTPSATAATCALTGTLSGLYNGLVGLPLSWRQQLWLTSSGEPLQAGGVASETELFELADRLLALWSGADRPEQWLKQPQFASLTAAPRVIQPS
jgi:hypothetical protein